MKLKKMDRRMTGYPNFLYRFDTYRHAPTISIYNPRHTDPVVDIYTLRAWCWETFGPSREVEFYEDEFRRGTIETPARWAWSNLSGVRCAIYLAGEAEAAMFTLKWL